MLQSGSAVFRAVMCGRSSDAIRHFSYLCLLKLTYAVFRREIEIWIFGR